MSEPSMAASDRVIDHYTRYSEGGRFDHALGALEFARTCEVLERQLPDTGTILDIGGGPGAYATWLLDRGYTVRLLDPVPRHIEEANARFAQMNSGDRAQAVLGDAKDLPFDDNSADAVLLLGPLNHLTDPSDRGRSLAECLRVLEPGAWLFAAGISRFASLLDGLDRGFVWDPVFEGILRRDLESGQHRNPTGKLDYFTDGYFHQPDELADEIAAAGFSGVRVLAVEGPMWANRDLERDWRDADRRALLLELARKVESEPALLGASPHLLAIAHKPRRTP